MQSQPVLILLTGWARSGKDSAAALLSDELQFERYAFADSLKEDVSHKTCLPVQLFHSNLTKDEPLEHMGKLTPRDLILQHALSIRKVDPDFYTKRIIDLIREFPSKRVVISDWRYRREYQIISTDLARSYTIRRVRITRKNIKPSEDPSEHDLDDEIVDTTITNDGSISDLRDALRGYIHSII